MKEEGDEQNEIKNEVIQDDKGNIVTDNNNDNNNDNNKVNNNEINRE